MSTTTPATAAIPRALLHFDDAEDAWARAGFLERAALLDVLDAGPDDPMRRQIVAAALSEIRRRTIAPTGHAAHRGPDLVADVRADLEEALLRFDLYVDGAAIAPEALERLRAAPREYQAADAARRPQLPVAEFRAGMSVLHALATTARLVDGDRGSLRMTLEELSSDLAHDAPGARAEAERELGYALRNLVSPDLSRFPDFDAARAAAEVTR